MDDSSKRFGIARFLALFLLDRVRRLAASDLRGEAPPKPLVCCAVTGGARAPRLPRPLPFKHSLTACGNSPSSS